MQAEVHVYMHAYIHVCMHVHMHKMSVWMDRWMDRTKASKWGAKIAKLNTKANFGGGGQLWGAILHIGQAPGRCMNYIQILRKIEHNRNTYACTHIF